MTIMDPYVGKLSYPLRDLDRVWSGLTLVMRNEVARYEES